MLAVTTPPFVKVQYDDVSIEAQKVADGIYMLTGRGGKSLAEIQAARPTADYDRTVNADGFIKPDTLVGFIVDSLAE